MFGVDLGWDAGFEDDALLYLTHPTSDSSLGYPPIWDIDRAYPRLVPDSRSL